MNIDNYYKTFHDSIQITFGKIALDYNLSIEQINEVTYKIPLNGFDINICLGFGHLPDLNVLIVPNKTGFKQQNVSGIGLLNFVEYQNPDFTYIDFRLKKPEELPQKVDRLASLLRVYCDPFLRGDFSIWPKIVNHVEEKINRDEEQK